LEEAFLGAAGEDNNEDNINICEGDKVDHLDGGGREKPD